MRRRTDRELVDPNRVMRVLQHKTMKPAVLRDALRAIIDRHTNALDKVLERASDAERPNDRTFLFAFDLAAKYGLGTNQNLTTGLDEDQPVGGVIALPAMQLEQLQESRGKLPLAALMGPGEEGEEVSGETSTSTSDDTQAPDTPARASSSPVEPSNARAKGSVALPPLQGSSEAESDPDAEKAQRVAAHLEQVFPSHSLKVQAARQHMNRAVDLLVQQVTPPVDDVFPKAFREAARRPQVPEQQEVARDAARFDLIGRPICLRCEKPVTLPGAEQAALDGQDVFCSKRCKLAYGKRFT